MNVYQFALPTKTNAGGSYERQLLIWEELALDRGGYTVLGDRVGAWRDTNADGKVYRKVMRWYEVALDGAGFRDMVEHAQELFPDQKSFYIASGNEATFWAGKGLVERPVEPPALTFGADGLDVGHGHKLPPLYNRRDQIEQLEDLRALGYSNAFTDIIEEAIRRRRTSTLRQLRDVEQEIDHAFRR